MPTFPTAVYTLCVLTSLGCTILLIRTYAHNRTKLLLWTALGFVGLSLNNLALLLDLVVFPAVDLIALRQLAALGAVILLLYGFVWEVD